MSLCRDITERAKRFGADIVGFGGAARFDASLADIWPGARTVVGLAFRVLRGSRRGIEEGTTYYQYTTTGVETIEETILPMCLLQVSNLLEDAGYTAVPQKRNQLVMAGGDGTNPEVNEGMIYRSRAAEHSLDFERAAVLCGLGERGLHGSLLTDDFGPFQRVGFVLTDAVLDETPLYTPHLCDGCGDCVRACPGHAIAADGARDDWRCAVYYKGAAAAKNPFLDADAYAGLPERAALLAGDADLTPDEAARVLAETYFYPQVGHGYVSSLCGKACDTACYIHLEEKGVLARRFETPFRKRPEWFLTPLG